MWVYGHRDIRDRTGVRMYVPLCVFPRLGRPHSLESLLILLLLPTLAPDCRVPVLVFLLCASSEQRARRAIPVRSLLVMLALSGLRLFPRHVEGKLSSLNLVSRVELDN